MRGGVAKNPATPPDVLVKLAEDQEKWVRNSVAQNLATPPDILAKLAEDREEEVRNSVAENPATPPDILAKLARNESRAPSTENPSLILEDLLLHPTSRSSRSK
ncbi:MAG: hypothetical protein HY985_14370 [Magnetospirillum sp.]|nr:hypothetical protein [Magnetospirillum sp.]